MSEQSPIVLPQPKQPRRQLHQSGVTMFSKCGTQFMFRYIYGIKRPPSAYMICGTATDRAVNANLDNKILTGELLGRDTVTDLAAETVEKSPDIPALDPVLFDEEDQGKSVQQVIGETKDKAVRLVGRHHLDVAPIIQPYRTARKFTVNLDKFLRYRAKTLYEDAEGIELSKWKSRVMRAAAAALNATARDGMDFVGEQDIVEKIPVITTVQNEETSTVEMLSIRDTKTSKKSPTKDLGYEDDQMTAYAMASSVIDGKLPERLVLDYLVDLKRGVNYVPVNTVRSEEDVDVYRNRLATMVAAVRQGVFVPTNQTAWWCAKKWCGFTEICPHFKQPKSVTVVSDLGMTGSAPDPLPQKLIQIGKVKP
ncbi:MAG: PD-(D/E)XK nuclease family protein [Mycobacteriales bacterium]